MKVVGLTGGIGSGKSTVARMLELRGARVIDADALARAAVAPGSPGLAKIRERFGPSVLDAEGRLDRRALGRIVFEDDPARRDLEAIVHPEVAASAQDQIAEARAAGAPVAVYDVPLLFENGLEDTVERVVVVWASLDRRRQRLAARDDLSEAEIEARIAAQMPLDEKARRAHHVIDNDGELASTQAQVEALYVALTEESPS